MIDLDSPRRAPDGRRGPGSGRTAVLLLAVALVGLGVRGEPVGVGAAVDPPSPCGRADTAQAVVLDPETGRIVQRIACAD